MSYDTVIGESVPTVEQSRMHPSLEFGVANHTRTYSNSHSGMVVMVVIVDIVGMVLLVGMLVELAAI